MVLDSQIPSFPIVPGSSQLRLGNVHGVGPQFDATPALALPAPPQGYAPDGSSSAGTYSGPFSGSSFGGEPVAAWVGMMALLALLGWFSTRGDSLGGANPAYVKVGGYNLLTVTVTAAVGFFFLKILFRKFPVPGISEFVAVL